MSDTPTPDGQQPTFEGHHIEEKLTAGSESPYGIRPIVAIYAASDANAALRQGEILVGVIQRRRSLASLASDKPVLEEVRHPYSIVASQSCDLEQDYVARQKLKEALTPDGREKLESRTIPNVLLAEAVTVDELVSRLPPGRDIRKRVLQNKDERYHVLQQVDSAQDFRGLGLESLGVDFRRYFTVPTEELYVQFSSNAGRRSYLASPYLEHFSKRFFDFHYRVALPRDHQVA